MIILKDYLWLVISAIFMPWRNSFQRASSLSTPRLILFGFLHILITAGLATALANWMYLAGKGYLLGSREMDLGDDDLPPISVQQLAVGLTSSMVTWLLILTLVVAASVLVADWMYRKDRYGFCAAARRSLAMTIWFVMWGIAFLIILAIRGFDIIEPSRWPEGETWEVRDRLIYLLLIFPVLWGIGNPTPGNKSWKVDRFLTPIMSVASYWLVWLVLWRCLPWIAIEAYTG